MKTIAATAAVLFALAAPVSALTYTETFSIEADTAYSKAYSLPNNSTATYTINVIEALEFNGISISASGTNSGNDLPKLTFSVNNGAEQPVTVAGTLGTNSFGGGFSTYGGTFAPGDSFTFRFTTGNTANPVSATFSFETFTPSPVPLPAGGLLLGFALMAGGGAAALRRKKKSDA